MKYSVLTLLAALAFVACGQNEGGDDAAAKAHADSIEAGIRAVYAAFETGNVDELDKYVAENTVSHQMEEMPGYPKGLAGMKMMVQQWKVAYPDTKMTIDKIMVQGDETVVLYTWTGTNTGDWMMMKATNKPVNVQGVDWIRFENGKMAEHWGFMQEMKMMQQLGMMPEMPGMPPADSAAAAGGADTAVGAAGGDTSKGAGA